MRDCGSHRYIRLLSRFDFEISLGHEKSIRKMGAVLCHNQTQWCDNFEGIFGLVQPQRRVLAPFNHNDKFRPFLIVNDTCPHDNISRTK